MAESRKCSNCGAELPPDQPDGPCPQCLAKPPLSAEPPPAVLEETIVLHLPAGENPGERIGRYKLLQDIGEGGFGIVYMAEQEEPVRRRVALKVIKLGMDTKQVIARFEAERQALALMDHPNIAKVFDAGATESGRPYFVMELVKGERITDYCDKNRLVTRERLNMFVQICHAIQHAHQKGVIHRDIKPSNILVSMQDGKPAPKVIDFGIAKATEQRLTEKTLFTALEQLIGTPAYMSPEQAEMTGVDIDTRSDIYSLGVLLYELLTGKTPFDPKELMAKGIEEMRWTIRDQEPRRPSTRLTTLDEGELTTTAKRRQTDPPKLVRLVRGDLDWIVMRCLEKDRTRRYETANGLASDLLRHLNNEPVLARPPSKLYRFQKMVGRNKLACAATSAVALALLLGVVVSVWQARRARQAERATEDALEQGKVSLEKARAAERMAETQTSIAEVAAREAKTTLAASEFLQASRLISEEHPSDALAYLVKSVYDNPTNEAVATRLTTLLAFQSWWIPMRPLKQSGTVHSPQFSPDGKWIVTAADDGTARVWDAQSGQPVSKPLKHNGPVNSARFSPDGKRIVTASFDKTAQVWDVQTGQPQGGPLKHDEVVFSAQFSPDGTRIVTASGDGARVWDAQSGQPLTGALKQGNYMYSAQFSPDGTRIVTASGDGARVWHAQSGHPLTDPLNPGNKVNSAQFSPDGKWIVTASADNTAQVWVAQTGRPLTEPLKHGLSVESAQFSPDGKLIVTASDDHTARVWNAQSGQPLTEPLQHESGVNSAQFSPDGKRIVTASWDAAQVWDLQNGQPPLTQPLKHGLSVQSAQFSRDGRRIVTASADHTARVWDAQSGEPLTDPMNHGNRVNSAQFSPDGKLIVTASDDHTARVWNAQSGQPVTEPLQHSTNVHSAQFSPDGERIVTASQDGTGRIWDAQSGPPLTELLKYNFGLFPVYSAQFSPNGKQIVTASGDGTARVWDAQSGQALPKPMQHFYPVYSAQFSPDGERVVTASGDGTARVWDAQSGQPLIEPLRHKGAVNSAQFSPDGTRIVTASLDGTACLWDAQSGQPLIEPLKHKGAVNSAQFSPDGTRIVTASLDGAARVWDVAPSSEKHPVWLPRLAEAISGQMLNKQGVLVPTRLDRADTINQIRQDLNHEPDNDDWVVWGRWFLADPAARTISPFSKITVAEYRRDQIKEIKAGE